MRDTRRKVVPKLSMLNSVPPAIEDNQRRVSIALLLCDNIVVDADKSEVAFIRNAVLDGQHAIPFTDKIGNRNIADTELSDNRSISVSGGDRQISNVRAIINEAGHSILTQTDDTGVAI